MSEHPHNGSFAYHAQAIALSAALTRPCCENIPGLASTSLSQTGGESYSVVRDYNYKGLITFDEASAYVTGSRSKEDDEFNTLSTVTIRNLNVLNMVQAEIVVARVTSLHKRGDDEGRITFAGSMIRNLTVGGHTVNVALDHRPFSDHPKYSSFRDNCRKMPNTREAKHGDLLTTSLVAGDVKCAIGNNQGYTMHLPEFGTIFIAQILMKPGYRRVSMLRLELGSPIAGSVEVCGGESNGSEYWP